MGAPWVNQGPVSAVSGRVIGAGRPLHWRVGAGGPARVRFTEGAKRVGCGEIEQPWLSALEHREQDSAEVELQAVWREEIAAESCVLRPAVGHGCTSNIVTDVCASDAGPDVHGNELAEVETRGTA